MSLQGFAEGGKGVVAVHFAGKDLRGGVWFTVSGLVVDEGNAHGCGLLVEGLCLIIPDFSLGCKRGNEKEPYHIEYGSHMIIFVHPEDGTASPF